ncbi:porin family protein [Larkinella sp. VNQ87]|uniref:porin family protein n=1 Tax=Larkinella sp. VNQ87 TaxID=3400921 RepID=UPI003C01D1E4
MNDSFHKRLTDHIRKTVVRHEVPYEPGSWEEFQRLRHRRRQRQPVVWFRYAMAACLLLGVLGVPVWLYTPVFDAAEQAVHTKTTDRSGKPSEQPMAENRSTSKTAKPVQPFEQSARQKPVQELITKSPQTPSAWEKPLPNLPDERISSLKNRRPNPSKSRFAKPENRLPDALNSPSGLATSTVLPKSGSVSGPSFPEVGTPLLSFETIKPRHKSFYRWSLRPLGLPLKTQVDGPALAQTEREKTAIRPIWGLSVGPQSVRVSEYEPSTGLSGGVFSEIPISRRFSLSTGLSMAGQHAGKTSDLVPMTTTPTLVATDIRLLAVDFPLNLRFRPLKSSKTGIYAEAGVSSLAFLNERYVYTYRLIRETVIYVTGSDGQPKPQTSFAEAQETTIRSEPAFRRIYWGRLINLSVGVERQLGDRFRLSAEPYLKYPIGPLTRENLSLGSGGVILRLGFQSGR